ncbi:MAG TPA: hypothetical protein VJ845_01220 [Haploplasma sp.]|nr:hypothetical protein [Haploplasma sp.]
MPYFRTIYELDNDNNISNVFLEPVDELFNYFMFVKDNELIVNSCRNKITKSSILFDIEILNKYKEQKLGIFESLNAFSQSFLIKMRDDYGITFNDLKGAIERGRNYNQGRNHNQDPFQRLNQFFKGYTVGSQS